MGAYISIPNLWVQRGPEYLNRFMNCLEGERSAYYLSFSPYVRVGFRLSRAAIRKPELKIPAYRAYARGACDSGYYRKFAPLNMFFLIHSQYELGEISSARMNIKSILQRWPNAYGRSFPLRFR